MTTVAVIRIYYHPTKDDHLDDEMNRAWYEFSSGLGDARGWHRRES